MVANIARSHAQQSEDRSPYRIVSIFSFLSFLWPLALFGVSIAHHGGSLAQSALWLARVAHLLDGVSFFVALGSFVCFVALLSVITSARGPEADNSRRQYGKI